MKQSLLKHVGIIAVLLGVVILGLHYFVFRVNGMLLAGILLIIAGLFGHWAVSKLLKD